MMLFLIGTSLIAIGLLQLGMARDRRLWRGYAVESFRYCSSAGFLILGIRITWIVFVPDEPGISIWAQFGYVCLIVGQLGLQMNNLQVKGDLHVPAFIRKSLTNE